MRQRAKVELVIVGFSGDYPNQLEMWAKILPGGIGTRAMLTTKPFQCHGLWSLNSPSSDHSLTIICKKKGFYQNATSFAELHIPISWFEMNTVYTGWFPMKYSAPSTKGDLYLKLQIHLHNDNAKAFEAPKGKLLVIPSWERPMDENKGTPNRVNLPVQGVTFLPQAQQPGRFPLPSFSRRKSDFNLVKALAAFQKNQANLAQNQLTLNQTDSESNPDPLNVPRILSNPPSNQANKHSSMFCALPFNPDFQLELPKSLDDKNQLV